MGSGLEERDVQLMAGRSAIGNCAECGEPLGGQAAVVATPPGYPERLRYHQACVEAIGAELLQKK